jgi:cyclin T
MYSFYVFHPFTLFHHSEMAAACLYLACKTEQQPRAVEDMINMAHRYVHPDRPSLNTKSEVSKF